MAHQAGTTTRRLTDAPAGLGFTLDHRSLRGGLGILLGIGAALTAAHLLVTVVAPGAAWGSVASLADLDNDASIGSWFSSLQYLAVGVACLLAAHDRVRPSALSRRLLVPVAALATYLAADEMFRLHERVTEIAERRDIGILQAVMIKGHGAWMALYLVVALVLIAVGRHQLRALWTGYRPELRWVLVGGALLIGGEVVFEAIGYLTEAAREGRSYELLVAVEEWIAMAGMSLVLYGVLLVLARSQELARSAARPSGDAV